MDIKILLEPFFISKNKENITQNHRKCETLYNSEYLLLREIRNLISNAQAINHFPRVFKIDLIMQCFVFLIFKASPKILISISGRHLTTNNSFYFKTNNKLSLLCAH